MWLLPKRIDGLLAENRTTRTELAVELECELLYLNEVFDGRAEAEECLAQLLIAALGADEVSAIIDWRRTAA